MGWTGVGVSCYSGPSARAIVADCFGLATVTFEDNIREPAAGLLELVAPLFPLEAVLLVALASSAFSLSAEDRSRIGGALSLTSAGLLATFGLAVAAGMPVNDPLAVFFVISLVAATGAVGTSAMAALDKPLALYKADLQDLIAIESPLDLFNANDVSSFYRASTITGLIVGAAFAFSPVSPIAVFDEELPVTHMLRADVGVYIIALLCPIQAALFRAARDNTLGSEATRALNTATGVAIALLVLDGRAQVEIGTKMFAALPADSPLVALVQSGDPTRPEANTTAAFTVGLAVALVYLYQATFNREATRSL